MTVQDLRTHFPHTDRRIYLNHAAVSPVSRPVRNAIQAHLAQRQGQVFDVDVANFDSFWPVLERARDRAAQVLGTETSHVDVVHNTSMGLNLLCQGLNWQYGDRIAVPDGTFPANVHPFMNLASEGVSVDFIDTEGGAFSVDDVEKALRTETRLLSISWVHFLSGFRADLEAIGDLCREQDVLFCVDAIQGLGALQLDVNEAGIDFLAAGGHKWLMATQGIGVLYCEESLQERIQPPTGWLHGPIDWANLDRYALTFHDDARRFRTGTLNTTGIVALDAALGMYLEAGPRWCEGRVLELSAKLADGLERRGLSRYGTREQGHASGIVTVAPEEPERLVDHLKTKNVTVALRNRKVRFSPTYYNDDSDLQAVFEAVDSFQH